MGESAAESHVSCGSLAELPHSKRHVWRSRAGPQSVKIYLHNRRQTSIISPYSKLLGRPVEGNYGMVAKYEYTENNGDTTYLAIKRLRPGDIPAQVRQLEKVFCT